MIHDESSCRATDANPAVSLDFKMRAICLFFFFFFSVCVCVWKDIDMVVSKENEGKTTSVKF